MSERERPKLLVVDDIPENVRLLEAVLAPEGYDIVTAGDGAEALRRLRSDERTAAIPVLALTAQAMQGDRERFLAAGFDGYLSKPIDVDELIETVRRYCDGGTG